jgi:aromatic ring-opening dioxygenase catalytic subunit (LigB family)
MKLNPRDSITISEKAGASSRRGILVIGSGNVVHNLHAYAWGNHVVQPFDWTIRFENHIHEFLLHETTSP